MRPKVSVIIPVYNVEEYLRECLDSVIGQTLKDIEIICVNDGSTDSCPEILKEYASQDDRIVLINKKNAGYGAAMNDGLRVATGEYIGIVESDDYISTAMFENLYALAKTNPTANIVKSSWYFLNDDKVVEANPFEGVPCEIPIAVSKYPELILQHPSIWSALYQVSFLRQQQICFNEVPGAGWVDNPFFLRSFVESKEIVLTKSAYYYYRVMREDSSSDLIDCSIPFLRIAEMLDYLGRIDNSSLYERFVVKRLFIYLRNVLNSRTYSQTKEHIRPLIESVFSRFDREILADDLFSDSDRENFRRFSELPKYASLFDETHPKVSIIVPIYNAEKYLHECLGTLVKQTLRDIEIICIDDGSIDRSRLIANQYAEEDARVKVICQPHNLGYGKAINTGIESARGEYIGIVESDDSVLPEMYEQLIAVTSKNKDIQIVKSDFYSFTGDGSQRKLEYRPLTHRKAYYNVQLNPQADLNILRANGINPPGIYLRRFLIDNDIRLNESPGASYQDNGLWFQMFSLASSAYFIDEAFYMIRRDNENSSVKSKGKVYCVCDEYDYIEKNLIKRGFIGEIFEYCAYFRYENYVWTIGRIDPSFRREFIRKFSADFSRLKDNGVINRCHFTPHQWKTLSSILADPEAYYYENWHFREELVLLREKTKKQEKRLNDLMSCNSYRIGRKITSFPRMVKRCIKRAKGTGIKKSVETSTKKDALWNIPEKASVPSLLAKWYERNMFEQLDLNDPKNFNQKIQWLKLNDSTPMKTNLADKYLVRNWITETIGEEYLVPIIGVWDSFEEIDFKKLPSEYVLKMNNGSGRNILVTASKKLDLQKTKEAFKKWQTRSFAYEAGFELHYDGITPKIIAEEYLDHEGMMEYQVWCFNGSPEFISVIIEPHGANRKASYSIDWERLPFVTSVPELNETIHRPKNLSELIEISSRLAHGFYFVRVDFYVTKDSKIFFSEMTFTPASGLCQWFPPEYDYVWGSKLVLQSDERCEGLK